MPMQPPTKGISPYPIPAVPACFFFHQVFDGEVTGLQVCRACEDVSGRGTIHGAQKINMVWCVYPKSIEARNKLLIQGISIQNISVSFLDSNPLDPGSSGPTTVKLFINNIPMSVSNREIQRELEKVEGVILRTRLFDECYRDEDGRLTPFKSGRRFVFINKPAKPVQFFLQVGDWRASLYHFGQRPQQAKGQLRTTTTTTTTTAAAATATKTSSVMSSEEESDRATDESDTDETITKESSRPQVTPRQGSRQKPEVSDSLPNNVSRSRPVRRTQADTRARGVSQPRRKRSVSSDHERSPSLKARKPAGNTAVTDYFDFTQKIIPAPFNVSEPPE